MKGEKRKKRELGISRPMLLSIIALCLTAVLIPMELLAWFVIRDNVTTEEFDIGVIGESEGGGVINVFLPDGSELGEFDLPLLPGESTTMRIQVSNVSEDYQEYRLNITDLKVLYPTSNADFSYEEKLYACPDYFDLNSAPFDVSAVMTEDIFKRFVAPVSNALYYDMYYAEGGFAEGYVKKYLTAANNATTEDLTNSTGVTLASLESYIPLSTAKSKEGQTVLESGSVLVAEGIYVNPNGTIRLAGGKQLDIYLVIGYDATKYVSADIADAPDANILTLKNSNPYSFQHLALSLNFQNV